MFDDLSAQPIEPPRLLSLAALLGAITTRILPDNLEGSLLIVMPSGEMQRFGQFSPSHGPEPVLTIHRPYALLWKALRRGSLGFAEAYVEADISCSDLLGIFLFYQRNEQSLIDAGARWFKVRTGDVQAHAKRHNSRENSRENISEHYDLGNEFFRRWLDPSMLYSSALYGPKATTLEDAQMAKLDLILDRMSPKEGAKILEIGCGWGALARHATERCNAHVTGITLSHEQLAWAEAENKAQGQSNAFRLQDYRDTEGTFDHIMSVEMIEAVGQDYWPSYFETLNARLKPGGTALIQAITIDEKSFPNYSRTADFIQRYIFPGGLLPTKTTILEEGARNGLTLETTDTFALSYAETLREWLNRFEAAWPEIKTLGFDDRFRRIWRYYLEYCEAGFREGMIDVGVYRLRKAT